MRETCEARTRSANEVVRIAEKMSHGRRRKARNANAVVFRVEGWVMLRDE